MIPIEETRLYKQVKENVQVRVNFDDDTLAPLSELRAELNFRTQHSFPTDNLNEPVLMQSYTNMLAEDLIYAILDQCGITREDIKLLEFSNKFMGKDCYDYIPTYRGCRMGARDSRNEESSGKPREER